MGKYITIKANNKKYRGLVKVIDKLYNEDIDKNFDAYMAMLVRDILNDGTVEMQIKKTMKRFTP